MEWTEVLVSPRTQTLVPLTYYDVACITQDMHASFTQCLEVALDGTVSVVWGMCEGGHVQWLYS